MISPTIDCEVILNVDPDKTFMQLHNCPQTFQIKILHGSVDDLYQRGNWVISDFRVCHSSTLDNIHRALLCRVVGFKLSL